MTMAKQTANEAYQRHQDDVGALLDLLGEEARRAAEHAQQDGIDWAKTGDLAHLRKGLLIALAQFAQQDEAFIVKHLDEMREGRE